MRIRHRAGALLIALVLAAAGPLWADAGGAGHGVSSFLLTLAAMLVGAKLLGELAERIGQPAVLGELLAGVLLGSSALGVIPASGATADVIAVLAELGVLILLFEIGLETDLRQMRRVGGSAAAVAAVGIFLPFLAGYLYWTHVPHGMGDQTTLGTAAIFLGAALTATSVGITARVLSDLARLGSTEGQIIIGAAVIDDVLGLVILTVVSGIAAGGGISPVGAAKILLVAVGFLVIAVAVGGWVAPKVFRTVARMKVQHAAPVLALAICFGLAALADMAGSALIMGAFAAGIILARTEQFHAIEQRVRPVGALLTPIFFVSVGSALDVSLLDPTRPGGAHLLLVALGLTLLAIFGKVAAGYAAPWAKFRRLAVGVGMVPRGEVGLIFADIGRRSGILTDDAFSIVLLMVMGTTFVAPPLLKLLFRDVPVPPAAPASA
ncbi:MAG TPA: cation:proton antiporter [Gemmatimonadales bacterium]|jgi:Kef-type K+ transport system membrane component KefB|nr:cation:proton antiporter [Gemmatimonadales bacterium]